MRNIVLALAAGCLLAGCAATHPEERKAAAAPTVPVNWKWVHPGAIVLEVRAADEDLIALGGGLDEGLAPGQRMGVYRGSTKIGTLQLLKVDRDATVARLIGAIADILPGDTAVYLPARNGN
jgi:hypothetical protein